MELYDLAQQAFIKAIDGHIRLLTLDHLKHSATQEAYEYLFNVFHEVGEKYESVGEPINEDTDAKEIVKGIYNEVEQLLVDLNDVIEQEKDEGVKNKLLSKLDEGQLICAKLKSLI